MVSQTPNPDPSTFNPACAGVFGVSVEVIFYSILDCVAKVWFSFAIVNRGNSRGDGGSDREDDYERQYV